LTFELRKGCAVLLQALLADGYNMLKKYSANFSISPICFWVVIFDPYTHYLSNTLTAVAICGIGRR